VDSVSNEIMAQDSSVISQEGSFTIPNLLFAVVVSEISATFRTIFGKDKYCNINKNTNLNHAIFSILKLFSKLRNKRA
jgi:hypothetical protein